MKLGGLLYREKPDEQVRRKVLSPAQYKPKLSGGAALMIGIR